MKTKQEPIVLEDILVKYKAVVTSFERTHERQHRYRSLDILWDCLSIKLSIEEKDEPLLSRWIEEHRYGNFISKQGCPPGTTFYKDTIYQLTYYKTVELCNQTKRIRIELNSQDAV